jgi:molybdate transport system substrate-binding protein
VTSLAFLSGGAAHALVRTLAHEAGVEVAGHFGAVGAMRERFLAGEPCDIVILTHAQVTELVAAGRAEPRMCADLGSVATSVAVRTSDAAPDVASAEGLRAALLAADAIYFPDPAKATAGIHFAKVLRELGVWDEVQSRLRVFPNGSTAMAEMARALGRPIGCTQATEILATEGVKLLAPLPRGLDLSTVYTAAVSRAARDPVAAARFYDRLADDGAAAARASAGFEGVRLRPATDADGPGIVHVVRESMAGLGFVFEPPFARELSEIDSRFVARGGTFDVAVAPDGHVAGCVGVEPIEGGTCRLRAMFVEPSARRHGIARRLLERMLAFARSRRFATIELETAPVMEAAHAFYAVAGFERVARAAHSPGCDRVLARAL